MENRKDTNMEGEGRKKKGEEGGEERRRDDGREGRGVERRGKIWVRVEREIQEEEKEEEEEEKRRKVSV